MKLIIILIVISTIAKADFEGIEFVRAYDADTITINIPNIHPLFGKRIGIRLLGVDTPELRTKDKCEKDLGLKARDYVREMFLSNPKVTLEKVSRGKYFRIVADMLLDGESISDKLIAHGYAVEYWGGTKHPVDWCKMLAEVEKSEETNLFPIEAPSFSIEDLTFQDAKR